MIMILNVIVAKKMNLNEDVDVFVRTKEVLPEILVSYF